MSLSPHSKALAQFHFCVLLWGFTAILGKLITLPALALVWWRMLIVSLAVLLLPRVWRSLRALSWRLIGIYAVIGGFLALHWLTFYAAVKLANASVAVTCMALGPIFLSLVEPLVARRRFDPRELLFGLAVVPGVALVVGGMPDQMRLGLWIGVLSAVFVAILGAMNKRYVNEADALSVTALELGAGALLLTLLAPFLPHSGALFPLPGLADSMWLVVLAFGCTLLPFALSLIALRQLSAFTAQLAINLEPIYAIVLAVLFFGEQRELGLSFYAGVAVILAAVLVHPLVVRRER